MKNRGKEDAERFDTEKRTAAQLRRQKFARPASSSRKTAMEVLRDSAPRFAPQRNGVAVNMQKEAPVSNELFVMGNAYLVVEE